MRQPRGSRSGGSFQGGRRAVDGMPRSWGMPVGGAAASKPRGWPLPSSSIFQPTKEQLQV
jgi:hypothetical protein